ncbi:homocysteine S-methyltransferase family protein [Vibrio sp. WXL210]|uniref:homocysteine S-methyltransferase family protein n=1 Tax=Vibrio sp. WXL210 TaxID=3450709 RepID=UPI003EC6631F
MTAFTVLDGGMGRELKRIGAPFSQPLWSAQALIEAPHFVEQAHQNFVAAGAEIIIVNSYACVPFHLGEDGYQRDGVRLAQLAAKIAHAVVGSNNSVSVAGSLAPPFGSYRPDLFQALSAQQIYQQLYAAQDSYVDLWIAETISSVAELEVVQSVLRQSEKPCHYAFTLQDELDNEKVCLRSGEPLSEALKSISLDKAAGVMFNCSVPEVMEAAVLEVKQWQEHSGASLKGAVLEIGVYANNFAPIESDHQANGTLQQTRTLTPEDYLALARRWHKAGATIIGGCCGISPEHIKALADWSRELR